MRIRVGICGHHRRVLRLGFVLMRPVKHMAAVDFGVQAAAAEDRGNQSAPMTNRSTVQRDSLWPISHHLHGKRCIWCMSASTVVLGVALLSLSHVLVDTWPDPKDLVPARHP